MKQPTINLATAKPKNSHAIRKPINDELLKSVIAKIANLYEVAIEIEAFRYEGDFRYLDLVVSTIDTNCGIFVKFSNNNQKLTELEMIVHITTANNFQHAISEIMNAYNHEPIASRCECCNKEFQAKGRGSEQRFCSAYCRVKFNRLNKETKRIQAEAVAEADRLTALMQADKGGAVKTCDFCGKEIEVTSRNPNRRFCGANCRAKASKAAAKAESQAA